MILTESERQTLSFYLWEIDARGWDVFDAEVQLEPAFHPYRPDPSLARRISHGPPATVFLHALLEGLVEGWGSHEIDRAGSPHRTAGTERGEHAIIPIALGVGVWPEENITADWVEQFLTSLSACRFPVAFELIGSARSLDLQLACFDRDCETLERQIQAHFPALTATRGTDALQTHWRHEPTEVVTDFGLEQEFMRPLRTVKSFDPDPLTGVVAAMEACRDEETAILQVLIQGAHSPWTESIVRSVSDARGNPVFANAPEMVSLAREKVRHPLFACVVRVAAKASTLARAEDLAGSIAAGLGTVARPESNTLISLSNAGYDSSAHIRDLLGRKSHRTGMILNAMELATLVHPLSPAIQSPKLRRRGRKSTPLPDIAAGHPLILGDNIHRGVCREASLSTEHRLRHVHVIGKTGTGKSTMIANMVRQDIEAGRGVAVLDPHGDLIDRIVELIPEERYEDTILFDPSDVDYPVGFNILEAHSEIERTVLSSDLVYVFRRFSTSWGDQMSTVLSNAVLALMESRTEGTLFELKRFLLEKTFRDALLREVTDPTITYFWEREFPLLRGSSQLSIITRLDAFLRSKLIRNIVCQQKGLNFETILDGRSILLVRLSQGLIGEENAHLLGSLICSKLNQVVMGRQAVGLEKREPFFCYLDEFQHFATPSMASMLSGARKYGFGLVMAHQDLAQISDPSLASSVLTNPATRICFALGDSDALKLRSGFAHFEAHDLMNLAVGEAVVRVERRDWDFNMTAHEPSQVAPEVVSTRKRMIAALSRERYARPALGGETSVRQPEGLTASHIRVESQAAPRAGTKRRTGVDAESGRNGIPPESAISSHDTGGQKAASQHRYLQTLIKKMAEQRGYRVSIEEAIADGAGRVDVGLEAGGRRIACEISVTTGSDQELHNIEKCLRAGYDSVLVCSPEKRNLDSIRKAVEEKLAPADKDRVLLFEPDELFSFLERQVVDDASHDQRVKGYRVNVQYEMLSEADQKRKREAIAEVVVRSLRRMKQDE